VNWLVDAQLPMRLARLLRERGEDAIHTRDLPDGNRSTDAALLAVAERDDRIIVTKDADFAISFRLQGQPRRLLLVATGNITNPALETLFLAALPDLLAAYAERTLIELHATRDASAALLVIHR
jgi:predicted nuclease of predicted toxin-antitoxin system